ncbi:MAG TPA: hypothetical protein VI521_00930 [Candidatus Babeliales bacterium]|nr:hypothetical protein [Candidatus Babeliales bacterium]
MNHVVKIIGDTILSSWIWQFTADWFHPVVAGIVMFFLLRITMRRSRSRAFLISLAAQLFSAGMLSIIAIGILVHIVGWEFDPMDPYEGVKCITVFTPSMLLGLLYALFQSILLIVGSFFCSFNLLGYLAISWISNGIGAILSYLLISMVEIMKYTG